MKFLESNNAEIQTLDFASIPCQSITLKKKQGILSHRNSRTVRDLG